MVGLLSQTLPNLVTLAADTRMAWEVALPDSPLAWLGWLALALIGVGWIVALYLRDTQVLSAWR